MTGPEHYKEAERLLEWADTQPTKIISAALYAAEAHATLALAAATVDASRGPVKGEGAWHEVLT
jgi:hypothetical protein